MPYDFIFPPGYRYVIAALTSMCTMKYSRSFAINSTNLHLKHCWRRKYVSVEANCRVFFTTNKNDNHRKAPLHIFLGLIVGYGDAVATAALMLTALDVNKDIRSEVEHDGPYNAMSYTFNIHLSKIY